jgi:hypothetical protein
MTSYAKQHYKRLCALIGHIGTSFFGVAASRLKRASVITESCSCSPRPELRIFGRLAEPQQLLGIRHE